MEEVDIEWLIRTIGPVGMQNPYVAIPFFLFVGLVIWLKTSGKK